MQQGLSYFDHPHQTLVFSKKAFGDLIFSLTSFFEKKPFVTVAEEDVRTGNNIHKIKLNQPIPDKIIRLATEIINNTKNCFDQSTFSACASIGRIPKKDIHFPWRSSPNDLEIWFESKKSIIPEELRDIFRQHAPYPQGTGYTGGDNQIRELARIANNKHTIGLHIHGHITEYTHPSLSGTISFVQIPAPKWNVVKNEMIVLEVSKDAIVKHDHKFTFGIFISGLPDRVNSEIVNSLGRFIQKAEQVNSDLYAKCREIIS